MSGSREATGLDHDGGAPSDGAWQGERRKIPVMIPMLGEEEAQAALANDRQADLLSMELRAMGRKTGAKVTPWKLAKEWAEKRVRLQTSQEAVSGRAIQMYARNVAKAASMAEDALAKGDIEEAFTAKQRQNQNLRIGTSFRTK